MYLIRFPTVWPSTWRRHVAPASSSRPRLIDCDHGNAIGAETIVSTVRPAIGRARVIYTRHTHDRTNPRRGDRGPMDRLLVVIENSQCSRHCPPTDVCCSSSLSYRNDFELAWTSPVCFPCLVGSPCKIFLSHT